MATYGEVRTKFKARLRRRDCDDALADGFLQDAIRRIQRILRIPAMEKSAVVTISAITYPNGLPIPSDYLKLKDLTRTAGNLIPRVLERRSLAQVLRVAAYDTNGYSLYYARQGSQWALAPAPIAGEIIRIDYWAEFPPQAGVNDTMILSNIAEDLMIFGALSYGCDHFNDKRGDKFEQRFTQILSDTQAQADDDELSGDAVVAPAFAWPVDHEDAW